MPSDLGWALLIQILREARLKWRSGLFFWCDKKMLFFAHEGAAVKTLRALPRKHESEGARFQEVEKEVTFT